MYVEQQRAMLLVAPFDQWLGPDITELIADALILEMPRLNKNVADPMIGSAHGGFLSTHIELTGRYTINALGGSARATTDMRVDLQRSAAWYPLRAIRRVVKLDRQPSIAETRIEDPEGRVLASRRGVYIG